MYNILDGCLISYTLGCYGKSMAFFKEILKIFFERKAKPLILNKLQSEIF